MKKNLPKEQNKEKLFTKEDTDNLIIDSGTEELTYTCDTNDSAEIVCAKLPAHENQHEDQIVGNFQIIEEVGRGGMGVVYKAEHVILKTQVAIKFMLKGKPYDRFLSEMEVMSKLNGHPSLPYIIDQGEESGLAWYAMEFIDGVNLKDFIKNQSCNTADILETRLKIFEDIVSAVKYAHSRKIIHGDIKHSNVCLKDNKIKVVD